MAYCNFNTVIQPDLYEIGYTCSNDNTVKEGDCIPIKIPRFNTVTDTDDANSTILFQNVKQILINGDDYKINANIKSLPIDTFINLPVYFALPTCEKPDEFRVKPDSKVNCVFRNHSFEYGIVLITENDIEGEEEESDGNT